MTNRQRLRILLVTSALAGGFVLSAAAAELPLPPIGAATPPAELPLPATGVATPPANKVETATPPATKVENGAPPADKVVKATPPADRVVNAKPGRVRSPGRLRGSQSRLSHRCGAAAGATGAASNCKLGAAAELMRLFVLLPLMLGVTYSGSESAPRSRVVAARSAAN